MHPDEQLLCQVLDAIPHDYELARPGEHALARLVTPRSELTIDVQPWVLRVRAAARIEGFAAATDLPLLATLARDWGIGTLYYDFEAGRVVASVGLWTGSQAPARRGLPARLTALMAHLDEVLAAFAERQPIMLAAQPSLTSEPLTLDALARVLEHAGQPYRRLDHLGSLAFGAAPPGVGPVAVHLVVVDDWQVGVRVLTLPPRPFPESEGLARELQHRNASLPWGMLSYYPESRHCVFQGLVPMSWARLDEDLVEFLVHSALDAAPLLVPEWAG